MIRIFRCFFGTDRSVGSSIVRTLANPGTVSAHHAMIFLEQGSFYITARGSQWLFTSLFGEVAVTSVTFLFPSLKETGSWGSHSH